MIEALVILAHSWYPTGCCSVNDCHPVTEYHRTDNGYMAEGLYYPDSIVKPSQDAKAHACYNPATKKPLCFFIPAVT